jgi:UrcA family protein
MGFRTFILAAALLAAPAAAFAAAPSVELKYDDLDLATTKGMAELNKRVDDAARQVCSADSIKTGTILRSKAENECYRETREKLQERVAALAGKNQRG